MNVVFGIVLAILGAVAWGGQTISLLAPDAAAKVGLTEREDGVDPAFYADVRGEAAWDVFTLWTMVVAGILLIADHEAWPHFGLVAGGMYLYFGGRGIFARISLRRRRQRIGEPGSVASAVVALAVWGVAGLATIVAAAAAL